MSTAADFFLAVDIGGTKLEVGVVSGERELLHHSRRETPSRGVWPVLASLLDENRTWAQSNGITLSACGVGCGGPMDMQRRTVSPLHIPEWRDVDLERRLGEVTGLPVFVDNDAKALVRAEWWHRIAANDEGSTGPSAPQEAMPAPSAMMSIVMGTGVGAGIIVNGNLLHGRTGNAGHIGHVIVEPDGDLCACGAHGCLEAQISGRALAKITRGVATDASPSLRDSVARWLGIAIATTAATVDLVDVTLGGSVALGFGDDFCAAVQRVAREHAGLAMIRDVTVSLVADRERAPLFGAAGLAKYPSPYESHVHR